MPTTERRLVINEVAQDDYLELLKESVIQRHGGAVRYQPTPGGGATFVLELPAGAAPRIAAARS